MENWQRVMRICDHSSLESVIEVYRLATARGETVLAGADHDGGLPHPATLAFPEALNESLLVNIPFPQNPW